MGDAIVIEHKESAGWRPLSGSFTAAAVPQLLIGAGILRKLPGWLAERGYRSIALCTGGSSFAASPLSTELMKHLREREISWEAYSFPGEPSPEMVDTAAEHAAGAGATCVVGIGGGAVMDAAKAVAVMVPVIRDGNSGAYESLDSGVRQISVEQFLEGVGSKEPPPYRIGLAAAATTAGTGSEATRNAVISRIGEQGYKKSLRHDCYVPDLALLDPELMIGSPSAVTIASGLDAIAQLLESFVSSSASIFSDLLAEEGLRRAGRAFPLLASGEGADDLAIRSEMAYAAYLSGITLSNAGLGLVHGAASLLGGFRTIPHGVVCGTLMAEATKTIADKLHRQAERGNGRAMDAYAKHSRAGYALNLDKKYKNVNYGVTLLLDRLFEWQNRFSVPGLKSFGFTEEELIRYAAETDGKKTPVRLEPIEIQKIFTARL